MVSKSELETRAFGKIFARKLYGGAIVCVAGPLGAGKSTFIRGVASGLGIKKRVQSPTFTLMQIYRVSQKKEKPTIRNQRSAISFFVHVDTYRVKDARELIEIGLLDYLGRSDTVVIIEWPEKVRRLLRAKRCMWVRLAHRGPTRRLIQVHSA